MTFTIEVSNLSHKTTTHALRDFFAFCGTISSIEHKMGSKTACIVFEKPSAAKTALMLNGGTLDGSSIHVASDQVLPDEPDSEGAGFEQSDKPRAGIAAEYLARGYVLSDQILQRAIQIDQEQGISTRFLTWWKEMDATLGAKLGGPEPHLVSAKAAAVASGVSEKVGGAYAAARDRASETVGPAYAAARERASSIDEERGISKQAGEYYNKAVTSEYYVNAVNSPYATKVVEFYTNTTKQVADLREEASRIAAQQKAAAAAPPS